MGLGPNSIDLTTLANVKTRAEVTSTSDDPEIQSAITGFSTWLTNWTGRATLNSTVTLSEIYNGNGNQRLALRSYPIQSVSSVNVSGMQVPVSSGYQNWGVFIDQSGKFLCLRSGQGGASVYPAVANYGWWQARGAPTFVIGIGNVSVTYTAGYPAVNVTNEIDTIAAQTLTLQESPWVADNGVVYYPSLTPLTKVASGPSAGQYSVSDGLYVFNAADNAQQVAVSYQINQAPFDLEYAVRCIVALNYKRKGWQDQESRGINSGGSSATTRYRGWDFPPEYWNIFQMYKRTSII